MTKILLKRRQFIEACVAGGLCAAAFTTGCDEVKVSRRQLVLGSLVREVVAPQVAVLVKETQILLVALSKLEAGGPAHLELAQGAWRRAAEAFQKAAAFPVGPLANADTLSKAGYWPTRPAAVDAVVLGTQAIDAKSLAMLGADVKGLFSLEYLLFTAELTRQPEGSRARTLALALGRDFAAAVERIAQGFGRGGETLAGVFARGELASLNGLVNGMLATLEILGETRMGYLLWMKGVDRLQTSDVEGWASGTSKQLAQASLAGIEQLYRGGDGGGLRELVTEVAPNVALDLDKAFDKANQLFKALENSFFHQVATNFPPFAAAANAVKDLKRLVKLDLAVALGVNITFSAIDGD